MTNANVQILFGAAGIKSAYEDSLTGKSLDIVCLTDDYARVLGDFFEKSYSPRLYGKVKTREILPDSKENREYATQKDLRTNEVRYLTNEGLGQTDMMVAENRVILVSYNKADPFAILISDPEMVKSFKVQFDALWQCSGR